MAGMVLKISNFYVFSSTTQMGVSENRGPEYSTLNSRTPIIRIPKQGTPNFRKLPDIVYTLAALNGLLHRY